MTYIKRKSAKIKKVLLHLQHIAVIFTCS